MSKLTTFLISILLASSLAADKCSDYISQYNYHAELFKTYKPDTKEAKYHALGMFNNGMVTVFVCDTINDANYTAWIESIK